MLELKNVSKFYYNKGTKQHQKVQNDSGGKDL